MMQNARLRILVDLAVALDQEIADKTTRLKTIKAKLIEEADVRVNEQVPTPGGGESWTHEGNNGCIARVSFPARTLKDFISGEGKTIAKIRQAAGNAFAKLFQQAPKYKPVPNFRREAEAILGKSAKQLIKLCESNSSPRVSFETKETP